MNDNDKKVVNLDQYKEEKAKKEIKNKVSNAFDTIRKHEKLSPENFLEAWKRGVKIVGAEFFNVKPDAIDAATDKWQLTPNLEFIQKASGRYSHGKQALLSLMYSFYDPEEGQKLLEHFGTPNFVSALAVLDFEGVEIIAILCSNHSGW